MRRVSDGKYGRQFTLSINDDDGVFRGRRHICINLGITQRRGRQMRLRFRYDDWAYRRRGVHKYRSQLVEAS